MLGFEQNVPTPACLDPLDRARCRTHYFNSSRTPHRRKLLEPPSATKGECSRSRLGWTRKHDVCEPGVGRIQRIGAARQLLLDKRLIVVGDRTSDRVMRRNPRLDQDFPT